MNALNVIRKPVITEKSSQLQEKKVYAFWINPKATKIDVKIAIKLLYGTDVAKVRMIQVADKFRAIRKGVINKRKESRKAYVTLANAAKLDLNKFEKADKASDVKLAATKSTKTKAPKADKAEKAEKKPAKAKKTK
jgi:large subunit ribosomal protein L23